MGDVGNELFSHIYEYISINNTIQLAQNATFFYQPQKVKHVELTQNRKFKHFFFLQKVKHIELTQNRKFKHSFFLQVAKPGNDTCQHIFKTLIFSHATLLSLFVITICCLYLFTFLSPIPYVASHPTLSH